MELTEEQFLDQYGSAKVKFSSYYKFTFVFEGKLENGFNIRLNVGGSSDDIYREHIVADKEYTVEQLGFYYALVLDDKLKIVAECDNAWL